MSIPTEIPEFKINFLPIDFDVQRLDRNGYIRCPKDYKYFQAYCPILVCKNSDSVISQRIIDKKKEEKIKECKENFSNVLGSSDARGTCNNYQDYSTIDQNYFDPYLIPC